MHSYAIIWLLESVHKTIKFHPFRRYLAAVSYGVALYFHGTLKRLFEGASADTFLSEAHQPQVDFLHSWAVFSPKLSVKSSP